MRVRTVCPPRARILVAPFPFRFRAARGYFLIIRARDRRVRKHLQISPSGYLPAMRVRAHRPIVRASFRTRHDFERKHGKIVPAVSQRPNFLLPFSVFRFPNRFFRFFLFLVAASSRSMLLQLLQRLHLFFFWITSTRTQSDYFHYYPPPACCCGTLFLLTLVRLCVFVARKKQRRHLLL